MPVKLHNDFISDLVQVGTSDFAGRTLRKCFDGAGRFIEIAKEDHRYDGIKNGWIRKINKGMRIIYIRDGSEVLLYRAGQHSVEDNLSSPASSDGVVVAASDIERAMTAMVGQTGREYAHRSASVDALQEESGIQQPGSRLFYSHADRFLYGSLLGRRFLPHKDVYLVSPHLSHDLMLSTHPFGQMLDELIEGGATVWLVTTPPPDVDELHAFVDMEARGINVFFNTKLHAKIYGFTLNRDLLGQFQQDESDFVVVGSASLTSSGLNPEGLMGGGAGAQYELSYQTSYEDWGEIEKFVLQLIDLGTELPVIRQNLMTM